MTSLTELLQGVKAEPVPAPAEVVESSFSASFIAETIAILEQVDAGEIEHMAWGLAQVRQSGGRLFILGVGGSAGHAGHAGGHGHSGGGGHSHGGGSHKK